MKELTARVFRYDPQVDDEPYYDTFTVIVKPGARVLDLLHEIHDRHDPTLSYRYCCGSGQCGSCSVRVNGEPVPACMAEGVDGMTIEPLNLVVIKDLSVDMEPLLEIMASPVTSESEEVTLPTKEETEALKPLRDCI